MALERLREPGGALLFLGLSAQPFFASARTTVQRFPTWASHGNRIVISFLPLVRGEVIKDAGVAGEELGFDVAVEPGKDPRDRLLYFQKLGPEWKTLVSKRDHPRIIARDYGSGAIILCSDSFLFSNEAILQDRQTRLIAQMVGDSHNIVFDEGHNGMHDEASMGTLARRYRLHGVVAGLLLLTGLFLWKSGARFLPAVSDEDRLDSVSGKDAASGLVKLLKRSVPTGELGSVCLAEWKKSPQLVERCGKPRLARIEKTAKEQKDPVALYRAVHQILSERN